MIRPSVWLLVVAMAALPVVASAADAAASNAMTSTQAEQLIQKIKPRADAGNAAAQYNLGVLYDRGMGVDQDYAKARRWYEKAAAQRYGRAEHNLGIMYEAGKGVDKNIVTAANWFRRGADDGQAASQNNLGVLYMDGRGVPQNTGKAAFWTARAAAAGNGAAIDNLPLIVDDLPHSHVNADGVNVRDQPSPTARVVRQVDSDHVAVILARDAKWTQILLPKTYEIGWVANFLLSDTLAPLASPGTTADNAENTANASRDDKRQSNRRDTGTARKTPAKTAETPTRPAQGKDNKAAGNKASDTAADHPADRGRIGVDLANLRVRPSRTASIAAQLKRGSGVAILTTRDNGWTRVRTESGTTGWLATYLIATD